MRPWLAQALTPLVDGLTVLAYIFLLPPLVKMFQTPSALNGAVIIAGYACLVAGTRIIRLLGHTMEGGASPKQAEDLTGCGGFLGFSFGIFTATIALIASGIIENEGFRMATGGEGFLAKAATLLFCLILLALVVIYPFVLILPAPKSSLHPGSPAALLLHVLGVGLVNVMVLISVAYWEMMFSDVEPAGMSLGFRIFALGVFLVVFAIFQAPPRILLFLLERNTFGLATFLISLCFYLWPLTG